ncbi:MAG: DNA polymerase domain-containing protein [Syntrophomonadaceae bacterium]|nr:DNA polymerase domain-containing protein [Syntrophomonadaceae bacterium]
MPAIQIQVNNRSLPVSNLEKILWPDEKITKAEVLHYYTQVAPYLLPHLRDRPIVMVRYPEGITGEYFYQKECPDYAPEWVPTVGLEHSGGKRVNYCLCPNLETLLWMANQAVLEIHPWLSRYQQEAYPDFMVLDLDPDPPSTLQNTIPLALILNELLDQFGLQSFVKTSGATGLHLFVPVIPQYPYPVITEGAGYLARLVAAAYPEQATVEHLVRKRKGRVYIDYLQNGRGKTLAAVYGLRPLAGAPVSMPLTWDELKSASFRKQLQPQNYNWQTAIQRLAQSGDIFAPVLTFKQDLTRLLKVSRGRRSEKSN